jgi:nucleotide-binding universal stress UspA family protein
MHAVVWIAETTWETCVDEAAAHLPADAEVTLLHVAPSDVELVAGRRHGPLGRHHRPPPLEPIAEEAAEALLADAAARFGRPARTEARRGRVEHEVVEIAADADLLILARDGERRPGPKSLGPRTRFVVDHAPCRVLLVWREP